MCGIAGLIRFQSKNDITESEIKKMLSCMQHRGPDNEGYIIFNNSIETIMHQHHFPTLTNRP